MGSIVSCATRNEVKQQTDEQRRMHAAYAEYFSKLEQGLKGELPGQVLKARLPQILPAAYRLQQGGAPGTSASHSESPASVVGPGEIDFQWARFSPRDKTVAGMDVVLCAPEKADADIENADQLVGKMAVVYRGECTFQKKTERLIAAGAWCHYHQHWRRSVRSSAG